MIEKEVWHKAERWAIEMVWERIEGRTPQALVDDKKGLTVADKVNELAVDRVNKLTKEQTDGDV